MLRLVLSTASPQCCACDTSIRSVSRPAITLSRFYNWSTVLRYCHRIAVADILVSALRRLKNPWPVEWLPFQRQ
jgi:hypothetical protein